MSDVACSKNPEAQFCQCDPPCGAICSFEKCVNPAAVLIPAVKVFGESMHMIETKESVVGNQDGMLDTSSPEVWAWVCEVHQ